MQGSISSITSAFQQNIASVLPGVSASQVQISSVQVCICTRAGCLAAQLVLQAGSIIISFKVVPPLAPTTPPYDGFALFASLNAQVSNATSLLRAQSVTSTLAPGPPAAASLTTVEQCANGEPICAFCAIVNCRNLAKRWSVWKCRGHLPGQSVPQQRRLQPRFHIALAAVQLCGRVLRLELRSVNLR